MNVIIKESTMVRPAQDLPIHRLWLSNLDIIHPRYHFPTLYLYNANSSSDFFKDIEVLKEALSRVLVPFYPAAGRLARDENGRIEINCNGEGVLFMEAETDSSATEFGDFVPGCTEIRQLIPTADYASGHIDISSCPLVLLQVTKFKCGKISLGVGWHHTLADGTACIHFLTSWSKLAQGLPVMLRPDIDRTILRSRIPPKSTFRHTEFDPPFTLNTPTNKLKSHSMANFKITLGQLDILKAKAFNNESKTKYTTYEILTAHVWRSTCIARVFSNDQGTRVGIAVDVRSRLHPSLSPDYFGNAVIPAKSVALSGDLLSEPFWQTVERIHKTIKRMDDEYLRSLFDYLEEEEAAGRGMEKIKPQTPGCPNLAVVGWIKFPFYDVDFGWGGPVLIRPGYMFEGKGYIYSNPTSDGGFTLSLCLETDHMKSLQKLFYDFSFYENGVLRSPL